MEDLRSGIRLAFERDQAMHPPDTQLRQTLVAYVVARPRIESRAQGVALVAAVLIAALLISTFLYTRWSSPATPAGFGPPPSGVQLFYVRDPNQINRLVAYDWSGRQRGAVTLPPEVDPSGVRMAPDGSGFAVGDGTAWYLDRLGNYVGPADPTFIDRGVWADDNRRVCFVADPGNGHAMSLVALVPGQTAFTSGYNLPIIDQSRSAYVQACSLRSDMAVVRFDVYDGIQLKGESVVTVRLSSGEVLASRDVGMGVPVVSADAQYIALRSGGEVVIYRSSDLVNPVAAFASASSPWAFSGDSSRLLMTSQPDAERAQVDVLDWRSNRLTFRYDLIGAGFGGFLARPSGTDFAVAIVLGTNDCGPPNSLCTNARPAFTGIVIVHGDGSTVRIPSREPITW